MLQVCYTYKLYAVAFAWWLTCVLFSSTHHMHLTELDDKQQACCDLAVMTISEAPCHSGVKEHVFEA